jgi:hypothetical protein
MYKPMNASIPLMPELANQETSSLICTSKSWVRTIERAMPPIIITTPDDAILIFIEIN